MNSQTASLVWLILGLPVLGWLIQCFFGERVIKAFGPAAGKRVMGTLAVLPIAIAFGCGLAITSSMAALPDAQRSVVVTAFDWITLHSISIPFEVRLDTLSMTMVLIITGIGALIHLYATGYMSEEKDYPRFFCYLNLFIAMMLVLVLGNNLALLFIGWEGVGLCSYLLIGFWYKDLSNAAAANKAFITNRIGDVGLTIGMFLTMILVVQNRQVFGDDPRWLSYDVLLPHLGEILAANPGMATAIGLCLFVGAMGKSAQFPLYVWLPDAMAGPTPVSALIHAATMVTAGVFLLNRMQVVFAASPIASLVVMVIGLITAIFAALIAFGQTDIKKVLAYSTVSQLGFMFIACGAGAYWVGMFHVITHAFFKALLFLGSGAVIHAMAHEQDMRRYGNLNKYIKITFWMMFIGWFAIAGFPWTSGWFSKEEILHSALVSTSVTVGDFNLGQAIGWTGFVAALLTAIYMTRMMMLTFFGKEERWRLLEAGGGHHHHEAHHAHSHAHHADHGEDTHGFFYTDDEMARIQESEHGDHHHELDKEHQPHEVPISMWVPLAVLAVFSLISGLWLKGYKAIPSIPKDTLQNWLASSNPVAHADHGGEHAAHHAVPMESLVQVLGYSVGIIGMIIGVVWYLKGLPSSEGWDLSKWSPFRRAAKEQFGYDTLVVNSSVEGGNAVGNFLWKIFDVRGIDGIVNGLGGFFVWMAKVVRKTESGYARAYALMMLIGSVAFVGYVLYTLSTMGGKL